ncbi:MAG: phosphotransferase [Actinobacteria bacterium]|nr:phosphotransferase [Actinomycetota bacterium]
MGPDRPGRPAGQPPGLRVPGPLRGRRAARSRPGVHRRRGRGRGARRGARRRPPRGALPELDLPVLRPAVDGSLLQWRDGSSTRLMRWVRGQRLAEWSRLPDRAAAELGSVAGRVSASLRGLDEPPLRRYVEWDPRHAVAVTEAYLDRCPEAVREDVDRALERVRTHLPDPASTLLDQQVVHLDVTDLNVLGAFDTDGTFRATGLVDFEDMTWTWAVCEPAVTAHAVIGRRPQDPLGALRRVLDGYLPHRGLSEVEADLLWDVVLARALICAVVEGVEAADDPGNAYAVRLAALDAVTLRSVLAAAKLRHQGGHERLLPARERLDDRVPVGREDADPPRRPDEAGGVSHRPDRRSCPGRCPRGRSRAMSVERPGGRLPAPTRNMRAVLCRRSPGGVASTSLTGPGNRCPATRTSALRRSRAVSRGRGRRAGERPQARGRHAAPRPFRAGQPSARHSGPKPCSRQVSRPLGGCSKHHRPLLPTPWMCMRRGLVPLISPGGCCVVAGTVLA